MKSTSILFPAILLLGVMLGVLVLVRVASDDLGPLGWIAAILGGLLVAWVAATLLNIALFAPIFWLLGKLNRGKKDGQP